MADQIIREEDNEELWTKLHKTWLSERKPGYVILGGITYRVLIPDEDHIAFDPQSGFDQHYGSQSRGL